ncbi:alpha/beta hydrolase family protein [Jiangella endophytica]|uniref:alpha/beta hydrolase family protein n=1 Tax=Jiangella endophytica TaxID=1623398 RepID=UPI0013006A53|nr:acetylxylan esterase [Jiangella endophytica]
MTPTPLGFAPNLDGYVDAALDLQRHVERRTRRRLAEWAGHAGGVASATDVRREGERIRAAVLRGLGGLPPRDATAPPVRWCGPADGVPGDAGYRIERLVIETAPGVHATASLYRPTGETTLSAPARRVGVLPTGRAGSPDTGRDDRPAAGHVGSPAVVYDDRPAVVFVCGHADEAKAYPPYQAVCARLARAGLVVLALDPFGQSERLGYLGGDGRPVVAGGTAEHTYAGLQAWWLGQSPARWFVHEVRRAVDLLETLPGVDATRIGLTGNSGGGWLTTLATAVEPRLAAAAPATFVTSRDRYLDGGQHQDAEQILLGGTAHGVDHADLLAATAPRPVTVLAAEYDFFPIEGTVESVHRARRSYELLGAPDALTLVTAPTTHEYAPALAAAATRFFCTAFGLPAPEDGDEPATLPPSALACTATGQLGRDSAFLHDLIAAEYRAPRERIGDDDLTGWLRERVTSARDVPAAPGVRWLPGPAGTWHGFWRAETDLWGAGVLIPAATGVRPGLRVVLLHDGTAELTTSHPVLARAARDDRVGGPLLVLDVRGQGALLPRDRSGRTPISHDSTMYKLLSDLLWLDDSLAAARAFDVTRAIDVVLGDARVRAEHPGLDHGRPVHVHAAGLGAHHAMLAAAADPRIVDVTVSGPVVDLDEMLTTRLHDDGHGAWHGVLPGLAALAPGRRLHDLLGIRLREVP